MSGTEITYIYIHITIQGHSTFYCDNHTYWPHIPTLHST
jgi:hypothetical protein